MAFRPANIQAHTMKFNTAASGDFIDLYEKIVDSEIAESSSRPKHQSFAPSQMRCDRISWFRLRGVQPNKVKVPDRTLNFTAQIGTACHEVIQKRLASCPDIEWIDVEDWIRNNANPLLYKSYTVTKKGYEQQIEILEPFPIRFACDGVIRLKGKVYLLEIKTSEFSSFQDLIAPKDKHSDQVKCYATFLNIENVLVLYQDRNYGGLKCFEVIVNEVVRQEVLDKMQNVMNLVEAHIAPNKLPQGDPDCNPNMCPYYETCKEW